MYAKLINGNLTEAPYYLRKGNKDIFGYNLDNNSAMMLADGYKIVEDSQAPSNMRKPRKVWVDEADKIAATWIDTYVEPTIEEQNEVIRQTRENAYRATSDYLKADYDEAVARGADNVEELKRLWLDSKDKIRADNPYITEG